VRGDDDGIARFLRLGLEDAERTAGWALTDLAAAVAYGAPLAMRTGQAAGASAVRCAETWLMMPGGVTGDS